MADNGGLKPPPPLSGRIATSVLRSVDATSDLLPHLPELFRSIPDLGGPPATVLKLARQAGLGASSRVVELACGKGTLATTLASELGCHVTACDAFGPFIDEANRTARTLGLSGRCVFQRVELGESIPFDRGSFEAGLMIGLWPFDRAAAMLRRLVCSGGVYIMDDALRDDGPKRARAEFEGVSTVEDARGVLRALGDEVLAIEPVRPPELRRMHASLMKLLRTNAKSLAATHPQIKPSVDAFVQRQHDALSRLAGPMRPYVLMCKRS